MTQTHALDPGASPLHYYGAELRRLREAAGLTQKQLGDIINYTASLVGQIETARRTPTMEFSERADAALNTGGLLSRLVPLVMRSQVPAWFQQVAEMESRATEICTFHTHLVHGLLQTEAYARAVLGSMDQTDLDDRTAVRLARQRIFEKEKPPAFWAVISEAALHQETGGPETMRGQLAHLLAFEGKPRINIQVLPFSVGGHAGLQGSFDLFRFPKDPSIVYTEGYGSGHPTANPDTVSDCSLRYDHLQAAALSLRDSAELIRRVMEDRYGEQRDRGQGPVAQVKL
ncbi:XRE family transcriptional regulator [Streptomyces ipomoeae]|uniref:Toxin-antitoxin system, antitoxin component, Xre family n=2 Tax=Streptomyces ipomoeae TaxID=103232 RepID=L1L6Q3_9ACTN|nr:helix-turn-helix transcriptional regulator [Streptomyces ipomoeae]EKX68474.1 toxin-antitoxin system, antitoxin component, Xre family [Streptomyces ipomoeae 91-03]MDX2700599.1 helix-turn-helix transcriptional regulator [Streptomyces ipomoeae]MDX2828290.1 helix-turn-helix transcriptional regulator [Streptomyces ipomoeae]MDX2846259.1 helix-turn-helix transcriptional regulator [Streptomyces ipomoeae]MDX2880778.1 helix-turn-helix transcriptional regulator [Streptomyces ipomoeae]